LSRKDEILDAIIENMQVEGFTMDITMSKIAEKVNIGKSTIYEYFKTKDEIFKEAILKMITGYVEQTLYIENFDELKFEEAIKKQLAMLFVVARQSRMVMEVFTKNFVHKLPDSLRDELKVNMEVIRLQIEERFEAIFTKGLNEGIVTFTEDLVKTELVAGLVIGSIVRYSDVTSLLGINDFVDAVYLAVVKLSN